MGALGSALCFQANETMTAFPAIEAELIMKIPEEDYPCRFPNEKKESSFKISYLGTMFLLHSQKWRRPGDPPSIFYFLYAEEHSTVSSSKAKRGCLHCKTCFCEHKSICPYTDERQLNQKMSEFAVRESTPMY